MYAESSTNYVNGSNSELPSPKPSFFNPILGERIQASSKCLEGELIISNYRLILHLGGGTFHVPTGTVDQAEIRKVVCLHIHCKDARSYKCTFPSSEECLDWQKRINDVTIVPANCEKVFAFTFYYSMRINNPELHSFFTNLLDGSSYNNRSNKIFEDEVKRLKFDMGGAWRISKVNENYQLCPSYPRKIIVPSSISDNTLEGVARFRSSRRFPSVVWRHSNGAVIARSSQPEVGWLWWRSSEDEDLVKALAEACAYDSPSSLPSASFNNLSNGFDSSKNENAFKETDKNDITDMSSMCDLPEAKSQKDIKKLLIMDARSYATAVANRARGGGCECLEYYPMCEIQFMNLDNIHTIRKSHQALRNIITLPSDIPNWLSLLENTRWLYHMSGLIKAAVTVAQMIAVEARPVLVHCSDGWDRTPQIIALAEILLDPYYRTFEGFQVLVEREWMEFGHKFSDRCGSGVGSEDLNERCPVFLQWIDCVYQILNQYPTAFQFNEAYLVKLAQHVYSNLFGTFLFNSSHERYLCEQKGGGNNYLTIWPLFRLNQHRYANYLYSHSNQVLYPSFHTKDLVLWKAVYMNEMGSHHDDLTTVNPPCKEKTTEPSTECDLVKTKSCDNLLQFSMCGNNQIARRSSDPNLRESFPDLTLLNSALGSEVFDETPNLPAAKTCSKASEIPVEKPIQKPDLDHSSSALRLNKNADTNIPFTNGIEDRVTSFDDDPVLGTMMGSPLQNKSKDLDKRSIDGSTDTLVSENGVLVSDEPLQTRSTPQAKEPSPIPVPVGGKPLRPVNGMKYPEDSSKKTLNGKGPHHARGPFAEEKAYEEGSASHSYTTSSVATCSYCLKSKNFGGDGGDREAWKHSGTNEVAMNGDGKGGGKFLHHSAQGHGGSSHIPSTPSEERYFQGLLDKNLCSYFSDGLTNFTDDVTIRLNQMRLQHQLEIDGLRRELQATKSYYYHVLHTKLGQANGDNHTEDQVSLPESVGSGSGESVGPESSGLSDASWEALEEMDAKQILWVPDHAVNRCMGCGRGFWMGRRKHHCRNCGNIFCSDCSGNSLPIPNENLYDPVRVCGSCFSSLLDFRPKYIQVASN